MHGNYAEHVKEWKPVTVRQRAPLRGTRLGALAYCTCSVLYSLTQWALAEPCHTERRAVALSRVASRNATPGQNLMGLKRVPFPSTMTSRTDAKHFSHTLARKHPPRLNSPSALIFHHGTCHLMGSKLPTFGWKGGLHQFNNQCT